MNFELLYTSMNTGFFIENASVASTAVGLVGLIFFAFHGASLNVVKLSAEQKENKVQWILKRNGMREVVEIVRQTIFYFASAIFFNTILTLLLWKYGFKYTNFWLLMIFIWVFCINMFLFEITTENGLRRAPTAKAIVFWGFFLIQLILSLVLSLQT